MTPENQETVPLAVQEALKEVVRPAPIHPDKAHNVKKAIDKLYREANRCERRGIKLLERGKSYVESAKRLQGDLDEIHKAVAAQNAPAPLVTPAQV